MIEKLGRDKDGSASEPVGGYVLQVGIVEVFQTVPGVRTSAMWRTVSARPSRLAVIQIHPARSPGALAPDATHFVRFGALSELIQHPVHDCGVLNAGKHFDLFAGPLALQRPLVADS